MYTLHHGFWLYFLTRHHPKVWQFVIGSMLPDYIYIVLLLTLLVKGHVTIPELSQLTPGMLMSLVATFPWVVKIDLIGHSVPVWFSALLLSFLPQIRRLQSFVIGWGTHLFIDALTHGAYSNFYLYPLSYSTVESPVSYWEHDHWFREFGQVNAVAMTAAAAYMIFEWWKKRQQLRKRGDNDGS
ncbi:DUF4184 family protein [Sporomusa aerivorans]|uniref:DUF4184 family protein n=1 Tax=Sporomusa aerivorans TaxID=204936 RepID=UPI00352A731F